MTDQKEPFKHRRSARRRWTVVGSASGREDDAAGGGGDTLAGRRKEPRPRRLVDVGPGPRVTRQRPRRSHHGLSSPAPRRRHAIPRDCEKRRSPPRQRGADDTAPSRPRSTPVRDCRGTAAAGVLLARTEAVLKKRSDSRAGASPRSGSAKTAVIERRRPHGPSASADRSPRHAPAARHTHHDATSLRRPRHVPRGACKPEEQS